MTREEAIQVIEDNRPTSGYQMLCEALDLAVKAIREREDRRWIPVTERLPDRNSTVLAFYEIMRGTSTKIQVSKGWGIYGDVTNWMPLPEPPKEEGQ